MSGSYGSNGGGGGIFAAGNGNSVTGGGPDPANVNNYSTFFAADPVRQQLLRNNIDPPDTITIIINCVFWFSMTTECAVADAHVGQYRAHATHCGRVGGGGQECPRGAGAAALAAPRHQGDGLRDVEHDGPSASPATDHRRPLVPEENLSLDGYRGTVCYRCPGILSIVCALKSVQGPDEILQKLYVAHQCFV